MPVIPLFKDNRNIKPMIMQTKKELTKQFVKDIRLALFQIHQEQETCLYTAKFACDIKLFRIG